MADSTREGALKALEAVLKETTAGDDVLRNGTVPQRIPTGGLILFDDGDPGEPDEMFSPPADAWEHELELALYVQERDPARRSAALDQLAQSVAGVLDADRTLGGKVDFVEFGPLVTLHEAVEGAPGVAAGTIRIVLSYQTPAGGLT